ncbi:MAG: glycosyltransferase family 2 protein [Clostridia bacterium]|nr:glycosyltransferase family 2 protein [Clostridia bacterium]
MNVLVLMAGNDDKFSEKGYPYPKNLIEVNSLPLVQRVLDSLKSLIGGVGKPIFLLRREENRKFHTGMVIKLLLPEAHIIDVGSLTGGAACTALLAIDRINSSEPLLIVNGDQILNIDMAGLIRSFQGRDLDGGIVVFEAYHPRWSYVKCDENGYVVETAEKRPISKLATAGVFYFKKGEDFVKAAMSMIKKDAHIDGKFYVCPCFNEMILERKRIGVEKIKREAYFSLANPKGIEEYEQYLNMEVK